MVEKVIRDGKVAVLTSPGWGVGWSTWADADQAETAIFDKRFVDAAEAGVKDIDPICEEVFGSDSDFCTAGWPVTVNWLEEGTTFTIEEYEGNEDVSLFLFTA